MTPEEFDRKLEDYEDAANDTVAEDGDYFDGSTRCTVLHEKLLSEYMKVYSLARELASRLSKIVELESTYLDAEDMAESEAQLLRAIRHSNDVLREARAAGLLEE